MKCLANRTLFALRKLLENLTALKKEKQSFNQLLVLTVFRATNTVRIVKIGFSMIEDLSASLLKYTTSLFEFCEEKKTIYTERDLKMFGAARIATRLLSIFIPPLFPFALTANISAVTAAFRDRDKRISSLKA